MNKLSLKLSMTLHSTNVINNVHVYQFVLNEAKHSEKDGSSLSWICQSELVIIHSSGFLKGI